MYQIAEPIITQRIGNLGLPVVDSFLFLLPSSWNKFQHEKGWKKKKHFAELIQ